MRSRPSSDDSVAEVTRRRLDALIAELAESRGEAPPESPAESPPEPRPAPRGAEDRPKPGRHAQRPLTTPRRLAGWVDDRLPAAMQGRAHLGAAQFGLVALVVAVGLVVGAWWLVRSGGSSGGAGELAPPRPAITSAPSGAASTGPGASPAGPDSAVGAVGGQATAGAQIVVDVVGRVRRPGIAVLPAGSRVVDAIRAAGGMRRGVDPAGVNLARLLVDGEQVVVGPGAPALSLTGPAPTAPGAPAALVNLNTADQATLETLPGVGPVTAAAILAWREEHGGFTSIDELLEVSGIGDATLAEIAPHVTL